MLTKGRVQTTIIAEAGVPITPHHDLVVVRREESAEKTEGGVIIPEVAKDPVGRGVVLAVGEGKRDARGCVPCQAEVGTTIIFNRYSGSEVEIGGETYLLLRDSEILGRLA